MPKKQPDVDWRAVERLMERCKRGAGHVPSCEESSLLYRAMRSDFERYQTLARQVADRLRREMMP